MVTVDCPSCTAPVTIDLAESPLLSCDDCAVSIVITDPSPDELALAA